MSITQMLIASTEETPEQFLKRLYKNIGYDIQVESKLYKDNPYIESNIRGFYVNARSHSPITSNRPDSVNFFTSQRGVLARFYKTRDYDSYEADNELIDATLKQIENSNLELALYFENSNVIVLTYDGQKLVLNSLFNFWDEERLALVKMPYTFKELEC